MPAASYTLATLRTELLQEVQDESGTHYTATVIKQRINNRMADFLNRVRCRRYSWTIDLVANQAEYDLSSLSPRCLEPIDVACSQSAGSTDLFSLPRLEVTELDEHYGEWRTEPASWPRVFSRSLQGPHKILLHPRPQSSQQVQVQNGTNVTSSLYGTIVNVSGLTAAQATSLYGVTVAVQFLCGALRIDGIASSTDLTNDSDSLETVGGIPVQWQPAIKAGVLADLYGDLSVPIAQVQKAAQYEAEYEAFVSQALSKTLVSFQGRPAKAGKARFF